MQPQQKAAVLAGETQPVDELVQQHGRLYKTSESHCNGTDSACAYKVVSAARRRAAVGRIIERRVQVELTVDVGVARDSRHSVLSEQRAGQRDRVVDRPGFVGRNRDPGPGARLSQNLRIKVSAELR